MNPIEPISLDNTAVAFSSKSDKDLKKTQLLFSLMQWEYLTKIGTKIVNSALKFNFPVRNLIKNTLFKQFCGGEDLTECTEVIHGLFSSGVYTILDYAAEGENEEESLGRNVKVLEEVIDIDKEAEAVQFTVLKMSSIADPALLEKVQAGDPLTFGENESFEKAKARFEHLCKTACENKVRLLVDAEESWIQGTIDALVYAMMQKYNKEAAFIFNTFQMYRADMPYNLQSAIKMSAADKFFLGVKLVRGAYLSKEKEMAEKNGCPNPLFQSKKETDDAFNQGLEDCILHIAHLELCCGTHNENSTLLLTTLMRKNNLLPNDPRITFAQLYGMSDHITFNLANAGFRSAKYLPFGPVEKVLPYLFRRAEENNSIAGQNHRQLDLINKELKRRKLRL